MKTKELVPVVAIVEHEKLLTLFYKDEVNNVAVYHAHNTDFTWTTDYTKNLHPVLAPEQCHPVRLVDLNSIEELQLIASDDDEFGVAGTSFHLNRLATMAKNDTRNVVAINNPVSAAFSVALGYDGDEDFPDEVPNGELENAVNEVVFATAPDTCVTVPYLANELYRKIMKSSALQIEAHMMGLSVTNGMMCRRELADYLSHVMEELSRKGLFIYVDEELQSYRRTHEAHYES